MSRLTFTRKLGLVIGALLLLGFGTTAKAETVFIVGNTTGSLATATVTCTFNAQTNTFTFTITNTSPFDARITGIGFDLPPTGNDSNTGLDGFSGSVDSQPAGVNFTFSDGDLGNVNQFDSAVLDFGFLTGSNFSGGDPNEGLPPGIPPNNQASFTVSGDAFAGMTEEEICNAIFVRFQRVGADGEGSDVGVPGEVEPIPEPATMLLLGTGLAGIAAGIRRRRKMAKLE